MPLLCTLIWYFNPILAYFIFLNFNCILVCTGLVGASRKSPCLVIIIIIIIIEYYRNMTGQSKPEDTAQEGQEVAKAEADTHYINKSTRKHATTTVPELLVADDVTLTVMLLLVAACFAITMLMLVIVVISCRSFRRPSVSDDRDGGLCECYSPLFASAPRQQVERPTKHHRVDRSPPHGRIGA